MDNEKLPSVMTIWAASPGQDFQYSHLDPLVNLCEGINRVTVENGLIDAVRKKYFQVKNEHPGGSPWFYLCLADYLNRVCLLQPLCLSLSLSLLSFSLCLFDFSLYLSSLISSSFACIDLFSSPNLSFARTKCLAL